MSDRAMKLLTPDELETELSDTHDWEYRGRQLTCTGSIPDSFHP